MTSKQTKRVKMSKARRRLSREPDTESEIHDEKEVEEGEGDMEEVVKPKVPFGKTGSRRKVSWIFDFTH